MQDVNRKSLNLLLIAGVFSFFTTFASFGQGTAFQYQGQLQNGGSPANGSFDFQFTLYNAVTNGSVVGGTLTNYAVAVNNGLFITTLDFGTNIFTGLNLWLDIGVRTNGATNFTTLSPLQPILPVPYAIFANSASNLVGLLPASQLSGTLPATAFTGYTNTVALTNGENLFSGSFSGTFSGNGGAVTNVNVTNLTGVLADSQLPINTAFLDSNQTFTASNTFNGANTFTNLYGNSFSGSFFGNGLVGWIVVTGMTVQASIDHGYLLTNSGIVTVTLPATANPGDIVRIACSGSSGWQLAQNASQSVLGNFWSYSSWIQSPAPAESWTSIACSSDGTKMVAAFNGTANGIYLSTDSGQTWGSSSASTAYKWEAVASSADGTKLVAAPTSSSIYTSTNSGSTWTQTSSGSASWTGVASSANGNILVAVGASGIYTNWGGAWGETFTGTAWTSVASSANGSNFIAADSGVGIYTSTNSGRTWKQANSTGSAWQCVAISADGTRLIAAVNGGGVYISTNSGTSWPEAATIPTSASWSGVASSSDGSKLVAVASSGYVYTTSNWGARWQTNSVSAPWSAVTSSSSGTTLAATISTASTATGSATGIYSSQAGVQATSSTTGVNGYITGPQCSSVELQCVGNNQFMPVNQFGTIWAY